jgi:CDP-6-deoxy-D-xylo-4-hexulose-3-dehydrase
MDPYTEFSRRHGLTLVEDSCETLGAYDGARHAGTFGHAASFSLYFSHHITAIEGGVVVTSDDSLADDLRSLRSHGWSRDRTDREQWTAAHPEIDERFLFVMGGYNVRPTEIQAAIAVKQLSKIESMIEGREDLARTVDDILTGSVPWLELIGRSQLRTKGDTRSHSWMALPMRVGADGPIGAAEVRARLEADGVETRPIIAGNLARHPAATHFGLTATTPLPEADRLLEDGLMIGCHPDADPGSIATLRQALGRLGDL